MAEFLLIALSNLLKNSARVCRLRSPEQDVFNSLLGGDKVRIAGFGACMIKGHPSVPEHSFFNLFVDGMQLHLGRQIEREIHSFPGFTARRASHFLERRVLLRHPDWVVMQFGSTDATVKLVPELRSKLFRALREIIPGKEMPRTRDCASKSHVTATYRAGTRKSLLHNFVKSALCLHCGIKSVGEREGYIPTMRDMIPRIKVAGAGVILLSPFPNSDWIENRWVRRYVRSLRELQDSLGFVFVDCHSPLDSLPKSLILEENGFHLSPEGHRRVGKLLLEAFVSLPADLVFAPASPLPLNGRLHILR